MRLAALVIVGVLTACSPAAPAVSTPRPAAPDAPPKAAPKVVVSSPTASTPAPRESPVLLPLAGDTFVIDPGHNGGNAAAAGFINRKVDAGGFRKECDTTGTETNGGYPEYAFALDVANRVAALLRRQGARVILTRTDSRGVGPCIDQRAAIANLAHATAAISVHADGGPPDGHGFHIIEPALAPNGGNAAMIIPSARLALDVRSAFARSTGEPYATYVGRQGLIARSDLGGLNLSRVPKVFIECANMRNASDALHVTDSGWRELAAEGIATGLSAFVHP